MKQKLFYFLMNFWPPFLGSGISFKVRKQNPLVFKVRLKFSFYNRNYVGVQYGGSLYSMCDPWFMLILMDALGPDFIVWDKAASIKFLKPGKSSVYATFEISPEQIELIKQDAIKNSKVEPQIDVTIFDDKNQQIAVVTKTLWVKSKRA